jgi:WD40 repeat protein
VGAPAILNRAPFATSTRFTTFTPDGRYGAAYASRRVMIWNASTGREIRTIDTSDVTEFPGLLPDASAVVTAEFDRLQAFDFSSPKIKELLDVTEPHGRGYSFHTAVAHKGTGVLSTGSDRRLCVWDVKTGDKATEWRMQDAPGHKHRHFVGASGPDGQEALMPQSGEQRLVFGGTSLHSRGVTHCCCTSRSRRCRKRRSLSLVTSSSARV